MTAAFDKLREIFLAAIEQHPPERWDAYLDEACGGDLALRRQAVMLLQAHTEDTPNGAEAPGAMIGPYKLLQEIGEGGMGVVWLAEQSQPVSRKVALKIIKPGMDSGQVLARFEAERQALALMDHPNIAKVLDAGTTGASVEPSGRRDGTPLSQSDAMPTRRADASTLAGRPYFVMELVKGQPITKYCDEHRLTPRERLELFVPVCQAIQHAHQKGIIHRDIKPSNVMIAPYDGKPIVKVIDFGIAKATGQRLTERTLFTEFGAVVGTLEYMSPEQAELNNHDIDTRSDIYSLGVLLYELLTGTTPLSRKHLNQTAFVDMLRMIREDEPLRPSTRLSKMRNAESGIRSDQRTPHSEFRIPNLHELDWIAMKCLEKDRGRRYETAEALAADVQRYLQDQPVEACPPSALYRFRKFARRNRSMVVSALLLVLTAGLAMAISSVLILGERAEAMRQRDAAQANLLKAHQAVDKYFTVIGDSTLLDVPGLQPLRKELLEAALAYYQDAFAELPNDPLLQADLAASYLRMAQIHTALDANDKAMAAQRRGLDLVEKLLAAYPGRRDWPPLVAGTYKVGRHLHFGTEHPADLSAAIELFDNTIAVWQRLAREHPDVVGFQSDLAGFHAARGELELERGQRRQALATYQQARDMWQELALRHPDVPDYRVEFASSEDRVGLICERYGRLQEAKTSYRRVVDLRQNLAAEFPKRPDYQLDLALAIMRQSRGGWAGPAAEAEAQLRHAQGILTKLVDQYPQVPAFRENLAISHRDLAQVFRRTGRLEQTESAFRLARALHEKLAVDFPALLHYRERVAVYGADLAAFLSHAGRLEEAAALYDEAIQDLESVVAQAAGQPGYRRRLAGCYTDAAFTLAALGRSADAEKACRRALELREQLLKNFHGVLVYHHELARFLSVCPVKHLRDPARAVDLASMAADTAPKALGVAHYAAGNWPGALAAMQRLQKLTGRITSPDGFIMAIAHWRLGRKQEADACYQQAVAWMEMNHPDDPFLVQLRGEAASLLDAGSGKEKPHAPKEEQGPREESVIAYDSTTKGAIQVRVDQKNPVDWFDILRNGKRAGDGNPKLLNGTVELAPGVYVVDVNRTQRKVTLEAGKKTILWTGELVVEGKPSTMAWYAMNGKVKLTSTGVEPLLNRASPLFPGTYTVFVDTSLTGQDKSLGEAQVKAGRKTVLKH